MSQHGSLPCPMCPMPRDVFFLDSDGIAVDLCDLDSEGLKDDGKEQGALKGTRCFKLLVKVLMYINLL